MDWPSLTYQKQDQSYPHKMSKWEPKLFEEMKESQMSTRVKGNILILGSS